MITEIEYHDDRTPDDRYRFRRGMGPDDFHWELAIKTGGGDWRVIRQANDPEPHGSDTVLYNVAAGMLGSDA